MERQQESTEVSPLLPNKRQRQSIADRLFAPLDRTRADVILLINYTVTGLLDSSATQIWGAFVSMQTGNSIYLGLGLAEPESSRRWIKSIVSIASFCIGSFSFARLHRFLGNERQSSRIIIVGSYLLQLLLITAAALIVHFTPSPHPGDVHDLHWHVMLPIALVAFQSSGQTATSRALNHTALTSTVLTSVYCDLFSDPNLFGGLANNATRNQRLTAPVLLIFGAFIGGMMSRTGFGVEGSLWTAAIIKGGIVIAWLLWSRERENEEED